MQGGERRDWRREGLVGEDWPAVAPGEAGWPRGQGVGGEQDWSREAEWRTPPHGDFNESLGPERGTYLGITQPYPESETYSVDHKQYQPHPYQPPSPPNRLNSGGNEQYPGRYHQDPSPQHQRYPDIRTPSASHTLRGPQFRQDAGNPGLNPANRLHQPNPYPDRYHRPDMYPDERYQTGSSVQSDPYPNIDQNRSYYFQVTSYSYYY